MYSFFIRFIYAATYFGHMVLFGEVYQLYKHWNDLSICWDENVGNGILHFFSIHYFLFVLLALMLICKLVLGYARKHIPPNSLKIHNSNMMGVDDLLKDKSLFPYVTLLTSFIGKDIACGSFAFVMLILWLLLCDYGNFNITVWALGYHQYKVSTAGASYWLISKGRITHFSSSYKVVEITHNILLKV